MITEFVATAGRCIQAPTVTLEIQGMIRLFPDGRIEYLPDYTPDDAAKKFWEAMAYVMPTAKLIAALREVLNSDMAMREEDEGRASPVLSTCREAIAEALGRK